MWSQSNHRYDTSDYELVDPYAGVETSSSNDVPEVSSVSRVVIGKKRADLFPTILPERFFSILAIYLWIKSTNNKILNLKFLFLGSLSM